jgi:sialic acid synthase SpsE
MPLISQRIANGGRKTYVIAEMAWAHNGSLDTAIQILHGAKKAGADAVGIHLTSMPDYMVPRYLCNAGQTISGSQPSNDGEIYRYLERLNLKWEEWLRFLQVTDELKIDVCAMCNDSVSLNFGKSQRQISSYALAAACFTEVDFVRETARQNKPMVLRIGGATLGEIERAVSAIRECGNDDIVLLHGIQLYPTDPGLLNLSALTVLKTVFNTAVGIADHIDGGLQEAQMLPALAIPYGISVIEKHITLDRALKHEDYEAALGVAEFARFTELVHLAERAIGDGAIGALTPAEIKYRRVSRKRAVARRAIPLGTVITPADITFKRADHGLDASEASLLVGRTLKCNVSLDDGLDLSKIV